MTPALVDRSPMDMIYFPVDYPKEKMANPGLQDPLARVIYSRPQKNGRLIFADTSVTKNVCAALRTGVETGRQ